MRIRNSSIMDDTEFEEPPLAEKLDTQISFTDESLANSVLAGMHTLRQAGQLCDCVLRVGKKLAEFTAHQAVLASVSPHFMAMFEQDPRTEVRKPYKVKETTPEAFQILLDYAYTGKLNMTIGDVKDVYRAAILLKFSNVANICSEYLIKSLSQGNCIDVRSFVSEDAALAKRIDEFIQNNMKLIRENKSFLSLPQINIKLLGESRGLVTGPEASTIAKLISDWLLVSAVATPTAQQQQEVEATAATADGASTAAAMANGSLDMQVLTKHSNVLFLDADNHLQDISTMDASISKTDEVQDYVKACKKYNTGRKSSLEVAQSDSNQSAVSTIAYDKVNESLYNIMMSIRGKIHNVVVRLQTVETLNRNSGYSSSSGSSAEEEDVKSNGFEHYYQSSVSSFDLLGEMSYSRCGVGLAAWNGKLVALGGNDRGECLDSVETYDVDNNKWSNLPRMSCPRGRFECAILNDKLYACGGSDGRRELDTVECYDGQRWAPVTKMPQSKSSAGVGVLNNELYVIGGYNGQRAERSCEVFNSSTKKWSKIAKLNEGRSQAAVCSHKGLLYAFGGTDSWNCSSSVEVYNPQTKSWSHVASMSQARRGAAAVNYKGKIYVVGGSDGTKSLDTVEIYDCETNGWTMGPNLQHPRSNAGLAVLSGRLYIAGGYGRNKFLSSMEVLEGDIESQWCSYHKSNMQTAAAACAEISTECHQDHNNLLTNGTPSSNGVSSSNSVPSSNGVPSSDSDPDH